MPSMLIFPGPFDFGLSPAGLRTLESAIQGMCLPLVDSALALPLPVDAPMFFRPGVSPHPLSMMQLAVATDSRLRQVLLAPAFARLSRHLGEVDAHGRSLRDFASFAPLDTFLTAQGAPAPKARLVGPSVTALPGPSGPIPRALWSTCLRPVVAAFLDAHGFGDPFDDGCSVMPACIWPSTEVVHAIRDGDVARITTLVSLGALEGVAACTFYSCSTGMSFEGLSAGTLAVLADGEEHGLKRTTALLPHLLPDVQDIEGRSLLHVARSPALCGLLLDHGVSPYACDHSGQFAIDAVPADCRAAIEQWLLSGRLSHACRNSASSRI